MCESFLSFLIARSRTLADGSTLRLPLPRRKASPLNPAQALRLQAVVAAAGEIPKTGSLAEAFATATNVSVSPNAATVHAPIAAKTPSSPILATVASFLKDLKLPFGRRARGQAASTKGAGVARPTAAVRSSSARQPRLVADTEIPADLALFGVPRF